MSNTHDNKVKEISRDLSKKGWEVKAHIRGYKTPKGIGKDGYIPDIHAIKGLKERIIEVDTPNTINSNQLRAFRQSASHRKNAEFEHVITRTKRK